ncbi:MAG: CRISPR-associated protein Cas6 [Desulfobacterium sp.]|jgi:hypothetical protein|nr:CRISPR-associated protein Cas6 [Desulfobacterium sp.]
MEFGNYRFLIKLTDDAFLPYYKGSTFRGLLGHAMRSVVCPLKRNECSSCILCSTCTYALVFETGLVLALPHTPRVSAPPHPMVLEPPLTEKREFKKGETLECGLLLFGKINKNLPCFIHAFGEMGRIGIGKKIGGKRAGFVLERVSSSNEVIFSKDNGVVSMPQPLDLIFSLDRQDNSFSDCLKIQMVTPLRILKGNAGKADLSFPLLLRSMIRRTTSLLNAYGQGEPRGDYALLVKKAEEVNHAELRSPPFKNALR